MKAVILAAGYGSRLQPLTRSLPKPLLVVRGMALIERLCRQLAAGGWSECAVNLGHLGTQIAKYCQDGSQWGLRLHYSWEPEGPLGTAEGIRRMADWIGPDPFLVISADIWTDYPFARLRAYGACAAPHLVWVTNPPENPGGDTIAYCHKVAVYPGVYRLQWAPEGLQAEPHSLSYANIGVWRMADLHDPRVRHFRDLGPIVQSRMQSHTLTGEYFSGQWSNVGTWPVYRRLNRVIRAG